MLDWRATKGACGPLVGFNRHTYPLVKERGMRSVCIVGCINSRDFSSVMRPVVAQRVEFRPMGSKPKPRRPDALELGYKQRK
jgi:hypothetical protein